MNIPLSLAIIVFCLIMSAYFSATETAFSTFNRIRVKNLAEKGNRRAERVVKLSEDFDTLISTILIGNNIVNILSASLATLVFTNVLKDYANGEDLAATLSTVIMTLVVLTFGEIAPKTMAKRMPEKFAMFSAPLICFLRVIFTPLTWIFGKLQLSLGGITERLNATEEDDKSVTEEELISIIEEKEEEGEIDEQESSLIKSAIEFNELEVGDIFTPRIDITAIDLETTEEEIAKIFAESGYSRLPVYDGDLDNITGILYYKDFYTKIYGKGAPIAEVMNIKPVIYVAKSQKINELLKELQEKQLHLAVVTDEYGSTAGIVTLEDILEEIVGEIWDEHDEVIEEVKQIGEKEYIVDGKANIEKVFDMLEINEEPEALTVNGWAMRVLGKIPAEGDSFEDVGLEVKVLKMNGRRVENLHITDVRPGDEDEEDEGSRKSDDDKSSED